MEVTFSLIQDVGLIQVLLPTPLPLLTLPLHSEVRPLATLEAIPLKLFPYPEEGDGADDTIVRRRRRFF